MNILAPSVEASQYIIGSTIRLRLTIKAITKEKIRKAITNKALLTFFVLIFFFIPKCLNRMRNPCFPLLSKIDSKRILM